MECKTEITSFPTLQDAETYTLNGKKWLKVKHEKSRKNINSFWSKPDALGINRINNLGVPIPLNIFVNSKKNGSYMNNCCIQTTHKLKGKSL